MAEPFVVEPTGGRSLDLNTFEAVVLSTGDQTDGAFSLLRTQNEPPGFGPPLHIHHNAAEAFYVLEGEYRMYLPDGEYDCRPGSFVYVPRGVSHTFQVTSEMPGKKLNIFAPHAMVGFFEALAATNGEVTTEQLAAIAADHDMEVVGPVPSTYL